MANGANPKNTAILPFQQAIKQQIGPASRIVGLVRLKHFFELIEFENLHANPRESKKSDITLEIQESLEADPDIFPLLSKGVLIASTNAVELDRDHRYKLTFENREIEGILDGGHNTLAIGRFILSKVLETAAEKRELREAKDFQSYKKLYKKHWQAQQDFLKDPANTEIAEILIPVELLIPQSSSDFVIRDFIEVIPMVQEARNKNAQLTSKTWANHEGLFEELKKYVDLDLALNIEWKANAGGTIDVGNLLALAWIPLTVLMTESDEEFKGEDGKQVNPLAPVQTYSSKASVLNRYVDLLKSPQVGTLDPDTNKYVLAHEGVRSALKIITDLPNLYEAVYERLPGIYNQVGKWGSMDVVSAEMAKGKAPLKKFSGTPAEMYVPEGFIAPFIYAFRALLTVEGGKVEWRTDPFEFLSEHGHRFGQVYYDILSDKGGDPQKVGKSNMSYTSLFDHFRFALTEN
jgi:hypothetical protein